MTPSPPRILLVHGAWAGPWVFDRLAAELVDRGFAVDTVSLPSIGSTADMYADAAAITATLDAIEGPVTLMAHSYGGIPTTQAGDHPRSSGSSTSPPSPWTRARPCSRRWAAASRTSGGSPTGWSRWGEPARSGSR